MKRRCNRNGKVKAGFRSAMLTSFALFPAVSAFGMPNAPSQSSLNAEAQLEDFVTAYTNVYFALGACNGFLSPQQEAPFDPFGPMLEKWPDSFKHQMIATREEGRLESLRLARVHKFTVPERAELCRRQMDSSQADLDRLRARYLK